MVDETVRAGASMKFFIFAIACTLAANQIAKAAEQEFECVQDYNGGYWAITGAYGASTINLLDEWGDNYTFDHNGEIETNPPILVYRERNNRRNVIEISRLPLQPEVIRAKYLEEGSRFVDLEFTCAKKKAESR